MSLPVRESQNTNYREERRRGRKETREEWVGPHTDCSNQSTGASICVKIYGIQPINDSDDYEHVLLVYLVNYR